MKNCDSIYSCLFQEGSKADIFDWLKEVVVPNLYNTHDYNGQALDDEDANKFISDYYAIRLGPPRLRMLRVKPSELTLFFLFYILYVSASGKSSCECYILPTA